MIRAEQVESRAKATSVSLCKWTQTAAEESLRFREPLLLLLVSCELSDCDFLHFLCACLPDTAAAADATLIEVGDGSGCLSAATQGKASRTEDASERAWRQVNPCVVTHSQLTYRHSSPCGPGPSYCHQFGRQAKPAVAAAALPLSGSAPFCSVKFARQSLCTRDYMCALGSGRTKTLGGSFIKGQHYIEIKANTIEMAILSRIIYSEQRDSLLKESSEGTTT